MRPQRPPKTLNKTLRRRYANNRLSDNDQPRWIRKKTLLSLILWVRTSWVAISIVSNTSTLQRAIGTPLEPYTASRHVTDHVLNEPGFLLSPQRFPGAKSTSDTSCTLQRAIGAPLELRTASRRDIDCAPSDPEILLSPQRFPGANTA